MTTTTYTISDTNIGSVLPIQDGFITDLAMTTSPSVYEVPSFNQGRWSSAFFTLRDSGWRRDYISFAPGSCSPYSGSRRDIIVNGSWRYYGDLAVVSVPRGSQWSISISDVPVVRQVAA